MMGELSMTFMSDAERVRRSQLIDDSRGAVKQGRTIEQRASDREVFADKWLSWFQSRMQQSGGGIGPAELLPDAMAELETRCADNLAAAIRDLKAELRKALSK
jgi:hypothetical protein